MENHCDRWRCLTIIVGWGGDDGTGASVAHYDVKCARTAGPEPAG
jgi:hypothetical protein